MSDHDHPYAVRGMSPREIVEGLICAYDDARHALDGSADIPERLRTADAVLRWMDEEGIGFCDAKDRKR